MTTERTGQGNTRGLEGALNQWLSNYRPGVEGVCEIDPVIRVTMPVEGWSSYSYLGKGTGSLTAGQATGEPLLTVPEDERWDIWFIRVTRAGGDNNFLQLAVTFPPDYGEDTRVHVLMQLSVVTTVIWWPDPGAVQGVDWISNHEPMSLEPGSILTLVPSGSGAAVTPIEYDIPMRRTKLVRTRIPT